MLCLFSLSFDGLVGLKGKKGSMNSGFYPQHCKKKKKKKKETPHVVDDSYNLSIREAEAQELRV
jgi:hypothetical protein